jgi:hypothetical protein
VTGQGFTALRQAAMAYADGVLSPGTPLTMAVLRPDQVPAIHLALQTAYLAGVLHGRPGEHP